MAFPSTWTRTLDQAEVAALAVLANDRPVPLGRILCPSCLGRSIVGTRADNGDPQDEESTDCPRCDPHDGSASLGHVASVTGWEAKELRDRGYRATPAR